jgi:hypothetical protein
MAVLRGQFKTYGFRTRGVAAGWPDGPELA